MAKKVPAIQNIYCPWCHAPLVFVGSLGITTHDNEDAQTDRYDCGGPERHTLLVMKGLD